MTTDNIVFELQQRIQIDIDYFDGQLPERFSIAWRGYLAALFEWGVIDLQGYDRLVFLLPNLLDDPTIAILQGRD